MKPAAILAAVSTAAPSPRRARIKRWSLRLGIPLLVLAICWMSRHAILRGMGALLITPDAPGPVDAIYVLGGAPLDRGVEAAQVWTQGWTDRMVFTGENVPNALQALDIMLSEGEVCRRVAVNGGVPDSATHTLEIGTSTMEEAIAILDDALQHGHQRVMILSTSFHLRRIRYVFRERFRKAGVEVLLHPAPGLRFQEDRWWESEEGLLMVYNEYVKLVYYFLRY